MTSFILALALWAMEITGADSALGMGYVFVPYPDAVNNDVSGHYSLSDVPAIDNIGIFGPKNSASDPNILIDGIGGKTCKYRADFRVSISPGPDGEAIIEIESDSIEVEGICGNDQKCRADLYLTIYPGPDGEAVIKDESGNTDVEQDGKRACIMAR